MEYSKLTLALTALTAIGAALIVTRSSDTEVALAGAGETGFLAGVSDKGGDVAIGERADIHALGVVPVIYGGNVAIGDPLTSDASGKAIVAAPAAGVHAGIVGFAAMAGEADDMGAVQLSPSILTGAT